MHAKKTPRNWIWEQWGVDLGELGLYFCNPWALFGEIFCWLYAPWRHENCKKSPKIVSQATLRRFWVDCRGFGTGLGGSWADLGGENNGLTLYCVANIIK